MMPRSTSPEITAKALHAQLAAQPRWASLLQPPELRELKAACPGAKNLIAFRKQCVGYFLAE